MNPRMSDKVATLRYQELVAQGLHEPVAVSALPASASARAVRTVLKRHVGALLARVRLCLQDVHAGPAPSLTPGEVSERGVSASSHEPIYWLSPCRLP